jgi:hypothetical protein
MAVFIRVPASQLEAGPVFLISFLSVELKYRVDSLYHLEELGPVTTFDFGNATSSVDVDVSPIFGLM